MPTKEDLEKANYLHYYLKFILEGFSSPVIHKVSGEESERVRLLFSRGSPLSWDAVIEFVDVAGRTISVKPKYVLSLNVLFDLGIPVPSDPDEEDDSGRDYDKDCLLILWVSGIKDPLRFRDLHVEDIAHVALRAGLSEERFIEFEDDDGEPLLIKGDKIAMVVAADYSSVLEEELREYEEQAEPKKKSAKKAHKKGQPPTLTSVK